VHQAFNRGGTVRRVMANSVDEETLVATIQNDPRVQVLEDKEQKCVAALAQALLHVEEDEDSRALFDDAGALIRYLRARKWNLEAAEEMIRKTAAWRKAYGLWEVRAGSGKDILEIQNVTGKIYVRGFDLEGRPIIVIKPRHENSSDVKGMLLNSVYAMERAVACIERYENEALRTGTFVMDGKVTSTGKFVVLIECNEFSISNMPSPSVGSEFITIMQNHFPERLGRAFLINPPYVFMLLYNALAMFMDPITLEKFQAVDEHGTERDERLAKTFNMETLEKDFGGKNQITFDSKIFLNTKLNDTEFGLEFDEQYHMATGQGGSNVKARDPNQITNGRHLERSVNISEAEACCTSSKIAVDDVPSTKTPKTVCWSVYADSRVLKLNKQERDAARALASELTISSEKEDHKGLYDDAGSLIRYLQSEGWSKEKAEARIRGTARWRKDFDFTAQHEGKYFEAIARENKAGKMYVRGYDRRGRPIIYFKLCYVDTQNHQDALRHVVYCVERAVHCLDRRESLTQAGRCASSETESACGRITVFVDFRGYSPKHRPSLRTVREAMAILQAHYPGRLGEAFLLYPPKKVLATWAMLSQFVDPVTRRKVVLVSDQAHHNELLNTVFDRRKLESSAGGENATPFNSEVFLETTVSDPICGNTIYGHEFDAQWAVSVTNSQRVTGRAPGPNIKAPQSTFVSEELIPSEALSGKVIVSSSFERSIAVPQGHRVCWKFSIHPGDAPSMFGTPDLTFTVEAISDTPKVEGVPPRHQEREAVHPPELKSCEDQDVGGEFIAERACTVFLKWGNEHSWFRDKGLEFDISMKSCTQ